MSPVTHSHWFQSKGEKERERERERERMDQTGWSGKIHVSLLLIPFFTKSYPVTLWPPGLLFIRILGGVGLKRKNRERERERERERGKQDILPFYFVVTSMAFKWPGKTDTFNKVWYEKEKEKERHHKWSPFNLH